MLAGDGPLLIVAGPGSGKTTVLAARIAHLVAARQIPPSSLLAITFATKAMRELRERLGGLLGSSGREVDVTTFHAFGLRIVRHWSEELGLGPGPLAVFGEADALAALRQVADELDFDLERYPIAELAPRLERYRLGGNVPAIEETVLRPLAEAYEGLLLRRTAVDFAAMLSLPLRLFAACPEALRLYQDSYRYVFSDEFQDVCASQYALLQQIAQRHRNLVVVGDPMQTLYGWRGADVRFLQAFQQDFPEAQVISLDENFRSTRRIVELANALGAQFGFRRSLHTDNSPGEPARIYGAADEQAEAGYVAGEIQRLAAQRIVDHPGEVAVLYRINRQAYQLALALRERGIPYRVRGGGDLFGRREVRDALAYLRLVYNRGDASALARIVNVPPRRLGRLAEALQAAPAPLSELLTLASGYGAAAAVRAAALAGLIEDLHDQASALPPSQLLDLALEQSGYEAWLSSQRDGAVRLTHLATLRGLAQQADGDLGAWLAELQLGEDVPLSDDAESVLLTTIHGAKGGEWRVVFVVGLEEGLLPHSRAVLEHPSAEAALMAELRVAYVAVTRARERLYLTYCRSRQRGDHNEPRRPSRFLRGLPVAQHNAAA